MTLKTLGKGARDMACARLRKQDSIFRPSREMRAGKATWGLLTMNRAEADRSRLDAKTIERGITALKKHFDAPFGLSSRFAYKHLSHGNRQHWPYYKAGLKGAHRQQFEGRADELPNAFIIGAAKSGTTSLAFALAKHPRIAVSKPKEPKFLGSQYHLGWDWYLEHFSKTKAAKVRLEASTRYTSGIGLFRTAPRMMKAYFPQARLIFICRHPMERIVSQWRHFMGTRPSRQDPFNALLADHDLAKYIVGSSMYWTQLQAYRAEFPDDQILCLTLEDMVANPPEVAATILRFLGLRDRPKAVARILDENGRFPHKNDASNENRLSINRPDWDPAIYRALAALIVPDARRFLEHLGKPQNYWGDLA
jgi:hypothetical protein